MLNSINEEFLALKTELENNKKAIKALIDAIEDVKDYNDGCGCCGNDNSVRTDPNIRIALYLGNNCIQK
jgi:hypothetical protein